MKNTFWYKYENIKDLPHGVRDTYISKNHSQTFLICYGSILCYSISLDVSFAKASKLPSDDYEWKLEFSSSRSDDAELIQLVYYRASYVDVGSTYL
ncbi:hypothetical protein YC2023_045454 [Brassica napus]